MNKQDRVGLSDQLKAELERLETKLRHAVTYRQLFVEAYSYLNLKIHDSMIGACGIADIQRAAAMLDEVLPAHMGRIKISTAVEPPSPTTPRWSELEL